MTNKWTLWFLVYIFHWHRIKNFYMFSVLKSSFVSKTVIINNTKNNNIENKKILFDRATLRQFARYNKSPLIILILWNTRKHANKWRLWFLVYILHWLRFKSFYMFSVLNLSFVSEKVIINNTKTTTLKIYNDSWDFSFGTFWQSHITSICQIQ